MGVKIKATGESKLNDSLMTFPNTQQRVENTMCSGGAVFKNYYYK